MNPSKVAKEYQIVSSQTSVVDADPHRLVQILMENALEKLSFAKACMARNNVHDKGVNISLALSIIEALQSSLNKDEGGEIAGNLNDLYSYMQTTLLEANLSNDIQKIDEAIKLLSIIKDGWEKAGQKIRDNDE
ncbi:MAG: flagellar export chaperone FliS [Candidatus Berkiella sp.]